MKYLVIDKSVSIFGETVYTTDSNAKAENFCKEYQRTHKMSKLSIIRSELPIRRAI